MALARTLLTALALIALLPASAQAATARLADPAGDSPPSFNAATDIVGLTVEWDGALTVRATFAERPRTLTLDVIVSEAALDETDPGVLECEPRIADALKVIGTNDGGSLELNNVPGRIEVPASWDGASVTYTFRDDVLTRELAARDPFACVSGTAGEDAYYGVFDGKQVKLTPRVASAAVAGEVRRRLGAAGPDVHCPRRTLTPEGVTSEARDFPANAFCSFTLAEGRRYRLGYASVTLDSGVPRVSGFSSRSFPKALRLCGITDFSSGWRRPPVLGASTTAWGRRVSCRVARRVALRWRGRSRYDGFRCRRTRTGGELVAVRCTKRGGRVVRFETGS